MSSKYWNYLNISVRGSAHIANGLPCQDCNIVKVTGIKNDILICAVSDGAGSAKYADKASQFVAETAAMHFFQQLDDHPSPEHLIAQFDRSDAERLILELQNKLGQLALKSDAELHDFSATLLLAIIHPKNSLFIQLGDGCWCASFSGILGVLTWPSQGEFVGQTDFVTSSNAMTAVQVAPVDREADFIVGISDGLERLGLDFQARVPHSGFFKPLVRKFIDAPNIEIYQSELRQFLQSERVCERTDDDKTVIMAVKNGYRL